MIDIYLRAPDRDTMDAALAAAGLTNEDGRPGAPDIRWSRIGTISRATGEVDKEGLPIMEEVPGYHANLRLMREATAEELNALAPLTIDPPATPYRVWFD